MSYRKQKGNMWGCWVVWKDRDVGRWHEQWMWDTSAIDKDGKHYFPLVFTETRREIRPLAKYMRAKYWVKSAKAAKVPMPEGP